MSEVPLYSGTLLPQTLEPLPTGYSGCWSRRSSAAAEWDQIIVFTCLDLYHTSLQMPASASTNQGGETGDLTLLRNPLAQVIRAAGRGHQARLHSAQNAALLHTYRTCPVQTFGRARTNVGRPAGRDLLFASHRLFGPLVEVIKPLKDLNNPAFQCRRFAASGFQVFYIESSPNISQQHVRS